MRYLNLKRVAAGCWFCGCEIISIFNIVNQLLNFPGSEQDHDDMVDAIGMALAGMRESGSGMVVLKL